MLMPTTAVANCAVSVDKTSARRPKAMTTKANSPPCASRIATSAATDQEMRNSRLAASRVIALTASSATTPATIRPICAQTTRRSIDIPTLMKNKPISSPLNGARSIST